MLCQLTTPLPTLPPSHPFRLTRLKRADPPPRDGLANARQILPAPDFLQV